MTIIENTPAALVFLSIYSFSFLSYLSDDSDYFALLNDVTIYFMQVTFRVLATISNDP
jgi:hypothetical protein